jgi:hypothetical protein
VKIEQTMKKSKKRDNKQENSKNWPFTASTMAASTSGATASKRPFDAIAPTTMWPVKQTRIEIAFDDYVDDKEFFQVPSPFVPAPVLFGAQIAKLCGEIDAMEGEIKRTKDAIQQLEYDIDEAEICAADPSALNEALAESQLRLPRLQEAIAALYLERTELQKKESARSLSLARVVAMPPGLCSIEKFAWIVARALGDKSAAYIKSPIDRGTPRGDRGKLCAMDLFGGTLFGSTKCELAAIVRYMKELRHPCRKPVGVGVVVEGPGAGKSFLLQRAFEAPLALIANSAPDADHRYDIADTEALDALDSCTMRLVLSYSAPMSQAAASQHHLVARVLFSFFCGFPIDDVSDFLVMIGTLINTHCRGALGGTDLGAVLRVLEADFASHRGIKNLSTVRTILFVDDVGQEKFADRYVFDRVCRKMTIVSEPTVCRDICHAMDYRIGYRGAIFTSLSVQTADYGLFTPNQRAVEFFAPQPLPVRDRELSRCVEEALTKFGPRVGEYLPNVMIALALTGGHARTVELCMRKLVTKSTLTLKYIYNVLDEVLVDLEDRSSSVQAWLAPSLVGASFEVGNLKSQLPFDVARTRGTVIKTFVDAGEGLKGVKIVPEVSLIRLSGLGDPVAAQLFAFLVSRERLFASRSSAIVFEELVAVTLALKARVVELAASEKETRGTRCWWPVRFGAEKIATKVLLFDDGSGVRNRAALFPRPSQVAPFMRMHVQCGLRDEILIVDGGKMQMLHIAESIWDDRWSVAQSCRREFVGLAGEFTDTDSEWCTGDAPILVYSNQSVIGVVLLYSKANGEARALMIGADCNLDSIIEKCKSHIKLSNPLRDFGIVQLSQVTVCILLAERRGDSDVSDELAVKCAAAQVAFHVVLFEPDQLRQFFGPSLMQLPFFNNEQGAASLWIDSQRELQSAHYQKLH